MLRLLVFVIGVIGSIALSDAPCFAQEAGKSSVTLKTGEIIEGTIKEIVPNKYVAIQTADGALWTIDMTEVESISGGVAETSYERPFSLIIGLQMSRDFTSGLRYAFAEPRLIMGRKRNGSRIGAGLSFLHGKTTNPEKIDPEDLTAASQEKVNFLPLFFNFHKDFGDKRVKPSFDLSVGYPISLKRRDEIDTHYSGGSWSEDYPVIRSVIYLQGAPGVSFRLSKKSMVNIALQYQLLSFFEGTKVVTGWGNSIEERKFRAANSIGFSLNYIY